MVVKKKILFIITHLELGGAQKTLLSTIKGLDKNKYEIYLYAGDRGYLKSNFLFLDYLKVHLDSFLVREINPFFDLVLFLKLFLFIKKYKFDIIHTHSPKASVLGRWAAYFAGVKNIIYTVHGWPFHRFMNPLAYHFCLFIEKVSARITKKIIVVSRSDLERGVRNKIASRNKFSLIHYGIDIEKFAKVSKEKRYNPSPPYTILVVSSLKPQKGIFIALKVIKMLLKEMPDLKFVIAGDGPLRKKVEYAIEKLGIKSSVSLPGWVVDIERLFKRCDLFLLTSLWEGLPVSLIEAVVSCVPYVVTNTGGVLDITNDIRGGIVVNSFSPSDIKDACIILLKEYKRWSKIIRNIKDREKINYWSYNRMIDQIIRVYKELGC